jgi:hypothetical protein
VYCASLAHTVHARSQGHADSHFVNDTHTLPYRGVGGEGGLHERHERTGAKPQQCMSYMTGACMQSWRIIMTPSYAHSVKRGLGGGYNVHL